MGFPLVWVLACTSSKEPSTDDSSPAPDDSDDPTAIDPTTVPLAGECAMADDYGGFAVIADGKLGWVEGHVADGVVPSSVHESIASDGDCQVLRQNNPFCDPPCTAGQACDFDGSCVPYPSNQDIGPVTLAGLTQAVVLEPLFPGFTYSDTTLPAEPFTSGTLVTLTAPDAPAGAFELHGVGVEALVPTDALWSVEAGADIEVHWSPPSGDVVRSEVTLVINIDQHGASPSSVHCAFADDGAGTVPSAIVDTLVGAGVTGFPNGMLERRTVDRVALGATGCADFTVSSPRGVVVDVVGYTSCITDKDCPDGQSCDELLQICE
jgi:hypothetical protein